MDAGLVTEVGQRPVGKQVEAIFDLAYDTMVFEVDPATGRNVEQMRRLNGALLRLCGRVIDAAFSHRGMVGSGGLQNTWSRLDTTWLTPAALTELNRHLSAIRRLIVEGNQQREGQLITIGTFGGPALRPRRADGAKAASGPEGAAEVQALPKRVHRIARQAIKQRRN